ncbi:MAG: ribonucleoside-diphosphate reductase subunit alpha [Candidatus Sungbacteria bacterium]|nr:ribonucleoside-diphosphate reductase subunit alpha [bacterium]MDZ4285405.1 ribonucleoside-diphosphate reductase subunit alpha [Candidatus Sungbacteria bacterium]
MATLKIKKRNGAIVDFQPEKITRAMYLAFMDVRATVDEDKLREMTDTVVRTIEVNFPFATPCVEDVQDAVEKELMKAGYFDVAKDYIIYRYQHTKEREEKKREVLEKLEENALFVTKRSGEKQRFSPNKLRKTLSFAIQGYEKDIDVEGIINQLRTEIYEDMTTEEISHALIMVLRSLIERDPAYSVVAARLLLSRVYKEVIGPDIIDYTKIEDQHRDAFVGSLRKAVAIQRLDPAMLEFDMPAIASHMVLERDNKFMYLGLQTITDRYLMRDPETKRLLETPQMFWMRVAMGTALHEEDKAHWTAEFYRIMSEFLYTPSTPTLFHAGTPKPQLSSCYLNTVPDSLDGIFKSYSDNAQLSKWSGGIGTDWTNIRGTGSFIKGTGVESQGVIPFLKIANDVTVAINRSGRRRGAACVYLETWHYDIEDFLELRKNTGDDRRRTHDMNTANWIPDLFMKRVAADLDWTLFSSEEVSDLHHIYGRAFEERYAYYEAMADQGGIKLFKRMKARDLWKKMLTMLFETGHPWITFKDPSNIRSPQDHAGVVHNSNLCTEITLNTSDDETAVCNLGSLNFAAFVRNGTFDRVLINETVRIAMRMLDNVIDVNFYPTFDAKRSNMRHRPVGLGIRGYQDALYLLDIKFDSEAAVRFADESMEIVSYATLLASSDLARERGTYESYRGSKWDRGILPQDTIDLLEAERGQKIDIPRTGALDWTVVRESIKRYGMRNSNCIAIAPTATTANIVGCVPTIEPIYKNVYVKSNQAGDFIVVNNYLVDALKKRNLWGEKMLEQIKFHDGSIQDVAEIPADIKETYKEVFEIDPMWLLRSAAVRGKWIDQSQSLNIYYRGTSGKEISDIYMAAWRLGLKTTYYMRTLAASQVEKSTLSTSEYGATHTRKDFGEIAVPAKEEKIEQPYIEPEAISLPPVPQSMEGVLAGAFTLSSAPVESMMSTGTMMPGSTPNVRVNLQGQTVPGVRIISSGASPNICKIGDPECESCSA